MKLVQLIVDKIKQYKAHRKTLKSFKRLIVESLNDGHFNNVIKTRVQNFIIQHNLPDTLISRYKILAYKTYFNVMRKNNQITHKDEAELNNLVQFFKLSPQDIASTRDEFEKLKFLGQLNSGNLPRINLLNVILQKSEIAFWQTPSIWKEERVVRRGYVGGSRGISLRIVKGVNYRIGSSKGQLVSETDIVQITTGSFIVTSKRLIFTGQSQSFQIPYNKIINMQFFSDGLTIQPTTGKTKFIQIDPKDADIAELLINRATDNTL
ncbi:MAG: hypothetical protein WAZ18_02875 [Alphaproteobacteria bacterium]